MGHHTNKGNNGGARVSLFDSFFDKETDFIRGEAPREYYTITEENYKLLKAEWRRQKHAKKRIRQLIQNKIAELDIMIENL